MSLPYKGKSDTNRLYSLSKFGNTEVINLAQLFDRQVKLTPNSVALEFDNISLTYAQLQDHCNLILEKLVRSGSGPDVPIGVCIERSPQLIIAILAIISSGSAYVPFDPSYPQDRIQSMISQSGIKTVLTQSDFFDLFKGLNTILVEGPTNDTPIATSDDLKLHGSSKNDLAYILFTSGSTGSPKGVAMEHGALLNLLHWQNNLQHLGAAARTLQFAPISFDVSFQEIFSTLTTGGTLVLIDDDTRLDASALFVFLKEKKINRLFLPYVALHHLAEHTGTDQLQLISLNDVITAGEQLIITPAIRHFFSVNNQCRLHNHYGPTETHVVTSYLMEGEAEVWPTIPSIGKAVSNVQVHILDKDLKPVQKGTEGEIYIGGDALARGYINSPELTRDRFFIDPFNVSGNSFIYRTGDLGVEREDGNILYNGRIDDQVKVRGYRIELGEIEYAILSFTGITSCAVMVREDEPGNKRIVAYYTTGNSHQIKAPSLRSFLVSKLPDYMLPSAFVEMGELPRTPSGKVNRKALPIPDTNRPDLNNPYSAPITDVEKGICRLWSQLLYVSKVGLNDNFFELGGNSLLALRFISMAKQELGLTFSVVDLYRSPTVAGILKSTDSQKVTDSIYQKMKARFSGDSGSTGESLEDGIAIIGMSGRFPGADTIAELFEILSAGKESTTFFHDGDLDSSISSELRNDPNYIKARGVLKNAKGFDAGFFNTNPKLATLMDPQQRIFLEVSWHALEDAGYDPFRYKGLIGVFAGAGNNTYFQNNVSAHRDEIEKVGSFQVMTANEKDYIATRVSHFMDLKGPAVSIHTACSTSLVSVIMACESLWNMRCDMAIAGGVAITSPVNSGHLYQEGGMFSSDGHTRPFDAKASGTVFSDGAGAVILKRYRDAIKDNDTVYAVIRGTGINNDGSAKASFTAPSVEGQASAVSMAYAQAKIDPETVSYIETHGTATPLGDPIEVQALSEVFGNTQKAGSCALGSVKSNFGHLTAAAGIAGLIKTVLMLKHKLLFPTLNFEKANPQINFNNTPFYVNAESKIWKSGKVPRRAGVSSFGVGGTNAHVVLEEAPHVEYNGAARSKHLVLLSARSESALQGLSASFIDHLKRHSDINIADLSYTLQTGRARFNHRKYIIASDHINALEQLQKPTPGLSATRELKQIATGVVFMFPGQGSQYVNMGATLFRDELVFKEAVENCFAAFNKFLKIPLRDVLYPTDEKLQKAEELIGQTRYTQPALFTVGYALSKLWMSWGIRPSALIGHSIGEFAAACISGVMTLEDAAKVVSARGELMQQLEAGSMISVRSAAAEVQPMLTKGLSIAAINGPSLCVVSGNDEEINSFCSSLDKKEILYKKLHTSHAFHSPMMEPVMEPFRNVVASIELHSPQIPVMSTSMAQWLDDSKATDPGYWSQHIRAAVMFADGIKNIWTESPGYVMLEMGPRNTASTLARQQATEPGKQLAVPVLPNSYINDEDWLTTLNAIGQLWSTGIEIDWEKFYEFDDRHKISLPGYSFENSNYWIDPVETTSHVNTFHAYQTPVDANNSSVPVTNNNTMSGQQNSSRKSALINELRNVMEDASGIELASVGADVTFLEMGLDSLFLTQAALTISKKYGQKITFRQLNEQLSTFNALAEHLDELLPVMESAQLVVPVVGQSPAMSNASPLENMIIQQMQMMQQQLQMLRNQTQSGTMGHQVDAPEQSAPSADIRENEKAESAKPFGAIARIEKNTSSDLNKEQEKWLKELAGRYNEKTSKSKEYTTEHRSHLADPRVVTGFKPALKELIYQVVVNRSKGSRVWDLNGNEYVDVLNGFGSNFLGYGADVVMNAAKKQLDEGIEIGPQHPLAGEVAKLICEFTGYDRAGFCNTGSEAVLGALRIARTVTGRSLVVCFNGSYHGINDEVIVRGSKKMKSLPAAAGIMPEAVENMLVLDYGTDESLEIIRSRADEIAAVLVEPIQSRRADFRPKEFLKEVRSITSDSGSVLIFDEVITGFRLSGGGAQEFFDIKADLGTYGKVIGGGMPIGVIAGKHEFMDALDGGEWRFGDNSVPEAGVTYFAGTFVRHPLALACAKAVLEHMKVRGEALHQKLNGMTDDLVQKVNLFCTENSMPFKLVSFGSLFKIKWIEESHYSDLLFVLMRDKGVHIYDGFPCFITDAFTVKDIEFVAGSFIESANELCELGFINKIKKLNGKHVAQFDPSKPPVEGARLGKDPQGNEGWFIPDPDRPGKFMQVSHS